MQSFIYRPSCVQLNIEQFMLNRRKIDLLMPTYYRCNDVTESSIEIEFVCWLKCCKDNVGWIKAPSLRSWIEIESCDSLDSSILRII